MRYEYLTEPWEDSFAEGDFEAALDRIEFQISLNLMRVHNALSPYKMTLPMNVYSHSMFRKTIGDANKERLESFWIFQDELNMYGYGRDPKGLFPREFVLLDFIGVEVRLEQAMRALPDE